MTRTTLLFLVVSLCAAPASAVIQRIYPLADIIADSQIILFGKVNQGGSGLVRISVERAAKGKLGETSLRITTSTARANDAQALRRRLAVGTPVVLFVAQAGAKRIGFGYAEGMWFHIEQDLPAVQAGWRLVGAEPYLVRTFRGSTDSLKRIVLGVLSGKLKAPAPDPTAKPAPEAPPSQKREPEPPNRGRWPTLVGQTAGVLCRAYMPNAGS